MNCANCKINKIGPEIRPFGGYLCSNEHLQCHDCYTFAKGLCAKCKATTKFLQMQFNTANSSSELQSSVTRKEKCTNSAFNKQFFEEIEIQSRISEESLSMKDSEESITQNTQNSDNEVEPNMDEEIEKNFALSSTCMKTLFMKNTIAEDNNSTEILEDHHASSNTSKGHKNIKTENIFSYKGDPNDSNTIETYGIRFMDSNESVQEFLEISKQQTPATAFFSNGEQQKSLSAKALRDFDSHNSDDSREVVHNYLESYSSTTFHQSPAYNCHHPHCNLVTQPRKQKWEMPMRTVSVSTESAPSLRSTCSDPLEENIAAELKPHDYFIMQAIEVSTSAQNARIISDKNHDKSSINLQQKLLETFREDAKIAKLAEKSYVIKTKTQIKAKEQEKQQTERRNLKREDNTSDLAEQLSNTYRAYYNVPKPLVAPVNNLYLLPQPQPAQQEPPLPQFQTVPCSNALAQELLKKTNFSRTRPVPACLLNITRSPIKCPESTCQRMIFVSDFCKHLVVDHINLTMERILPFQYKNFFLDARLFHCGSSKCHLLYLMCNKISDLGSSEYKDFLPILVMTTRISINQMCDGKSQTSKLDYFLVWVTGIAPEELPVSVSLTVWSRTGRVPSCHVVYSGQMYSIRNSQNAIDVWQSGRVLLLSSQQIDALTDNGKEMLNFQLSVN